MSEFHQFDLDLLTDGRRRRLTVRLAVPYAVAVFDDGPGRLLTGGVVGQRLKLLPRVDLPVPLVGGRVELHREGHELRLTLDPVGLRVSGSLGAHSWVEDDDGLLVWLGRELRQHLRRVLACEAEVRRLESLALARQGSPNELVEALWSLSWEHLVFGWRPQAERAARHGLDLVNRAPGHGRDERVRSLGRRLADLFGRLGSPELARLLATP